MIVYFLSRKLLLVYFLLFMTIKERLLQYLEFKGVTKYRFYKDIGVSNGFLDKDGAIGSDKCEVICSHYNDLSAEWLIMGHGTMLLSEPSSEAITLSPKKVDLSEIEVLRAKIEKLEAKLDEKDEQIGVLIRNLDKLTEKNSNEAVKEKEGSRNVKESAKGV